MKKPHIRYSRVVHKKIETSFAACKYFLKKPVRIGRITRIGTPVNTVYTIFTSYVISYFGKFIHG